MDTSEEVVRVKSEVLNHDLLSQYKQLKTGLLNKLIDAYLDEAPKYFAAISKGVDAGNFETVVANCHALKSCSGNLGVIQLSRTCQLMENAAKAEDEDEVHQLFEALGPQAFEAEEALKGEARAIQ